MKLCELKRRNEVSRGRSTILFFIFRSVLFFFFFFNYSNLTWRNSCDLFGNWLRIDLISTCIYFNY